MKKDVKLVLSGGGARGFAHIGALIGLAELGINPIAISGTSAGSLVGAFIADGFQPKEIKEIFEKHKFKKSLHFSNLKAGIFTSDSIHEIISKNIRSKNIEDLKMPFFVTATNLLNGDRIVFNSGPIIERVVASCSIPILLPPVYIDNVPYVDGGVTSNLPVEPFIPKDKTKIIGINVNPISPYSSETGIIDTVDRTIQLCLKENVMRNASSCDVFIEPIGIEKYQLMDNEKVREIIELGYMHIKTITTQLSSL
jgi:NTE family protein